MEDANECSAARPAGARGAGSSRGRAGSAVRATNSRGSNEWDAPAVTALGAIASLGAVAAPVLQQKVRATAGR